MLENYLENLKRLIIHPEGNNYAKAFKEGAEVHWPHQKNNVTDRELIENYNGDNSYGVMLCDRTGLTKAGAIDIDIPRDAPTLTEAYTLAKKIVSVGETKGIPLQIEYSGNRGYHVWIFFEQPLYVDIVQKFLKAIAKKADFSPPEIFPNKFPETKCIKLPGAINQKSGKRAGFVTKDQPEIVELDQQNELMAKFELTPPDKVISLAGDLKAKNEQKTSAQTPIQWDNLPDKFIPSCVSHLAKKGAPLEIDYNFSNMTIARFAVSKGLSDDEAIALATEMAKNTPESHPTSKITIEAKVKNFRSAYSSVKSNPEKYNWECSYPLSKCNSSSERGCTGSACEIADNTAKGKEFKGNKSAYNLYNLPNPSKKTVTAHRDIYLGITALTEADQEICTPNLLSACEKLSSEPGKFTEAIALKEAVVLAFLLKNIELISDYELIPEGLIAGSDLKLLDYLAYLDNLTLPSQETIEGYIREINQRGLKVRADLACQEFIGSNDQLLESDLSNLIEKSELIFKESVNEKEFKLSLGDHLLELIPEILDGEKVSIPSFSPELNKYLNGGFQPGALYILGAPPASGKSTFLMNIADYLASNNYQVLYVSYEMSRKQFVIAGLSRLSKVDSAIIEAKKLEKFPDLENRVHDSIDKYIEIADNIHIIEADFYLSIPKIKGIIKSLDPAIVFIDYLQLMPSGDDRLDSSANETVRISKIGTDLKRLARNTKKPIVAISDISKAANTDAKNGTGLSMDSLRDSFKLAHAADTVMLLDSGFVIDRKEKQKYNQLEFIKLNDVANAQIYDELMDKYPLNRNLKDTYSNLRIDKNRGGLTTNLIYKYSKAIHLFTEMPLDLEREITHNNTF